jgi:hypothetical protein
MPARFSPSIAKAGLDQGSQLDEQPDEQKHRDTDDRRKTFGLIESAQRAREFSPTIRPRVGAHRGSGTLVSDRTHRGFLRIVTKL